MARASCLNPTKPGYKLHSEISLETLDYLWRLRKGQRKNVCSTNRASSTVAMLSRIATATRHLFLEWCCKFQICKRCCTATAVQKIWCSYQYITTVFAVTGRVPATRHSSKPLGLWRLSNLAPASAAHYRAILSEDWMALLFWRIILQKPGDAPVGASQAQGMSYPWTVPKIFVVSMFASSGKNSKNHQTWIKGVNGASEVV